MTQTNGGAPDRPGKDVVLILGAGRSGTTLVYKGLCMHPQSAWISNYMVRFPLPVASAMLGRVVRYFPQLRLAAWYGKGGNAYLIGRRNILKLVPTPVEGEAVYAACGIPEFPHADWRISAAQRSCLRKRFERIRQAHGGDFLITKRTANNRRIPQLFEAFPNAKFIHVVRDGRFVALSLVKVPWWADHKVWWWNQKTPRQWEAGGGNPLELAARNWVEEMREIEVGMRALPTDQVMCISYEELVKNPERIWTGLADFLGLDLDPQWLDGIMSVSMYDANRNWASEVSGEEARMIEDIQRATLERLGYKAT